MGLEKEERIPPRVGAKWERISTGVHRTKIPVESVLTISQKCSVTLSKTGMDLSPEGLDLNILVLKYTVRVDYRYPIIRGSFGAEVNSQPPCKMSSCAAAASLTTFIKHPPPAPR
jgi:hypothetical protein